VDVNTWCVDRLGSSPRATLFESGNLSTVTGVELDDGQQVVIKVRPWSARLGSCSSAQLLAYQRGFPCPRPLVATEQVDGLAISSEELLAGGNQLDVDLPEAAHLFAELLRRLVVTLDGAVHGLTIAPSPPWVGWDHAGTRLWPDQDDQGRDLNALIGPAWLDDIARRARDYLLSLDLPLTLGHGDWESQNIRWTGATPYAVHDWDSLVAQPEAAIAGAASAVWVAQDIPDQPAATVAESARFLDAYQQHRGGLWSRDERRAAWAAGLWVRAFNAKKDAVVGGGLEFDCLEAQIAERSSLAGL
jgi:Phosphotransferase enzyme family